LLAAAGLLTAQQQLSRWPAAFRMTKSDDGVGSKYRQRSEARINDV
jgi:hypothetical protein